MGLELALWENNLGPVCKDVTGRMDNERLCQLEVEKSNR